MDDEPSSSKKDKDNNTPTVLETNKTEERRVLVRHDLPQEKSTSPELGSY